MINLKNISKRFGRYHALDDVSLDLVPGEAVALWGPNGAGKTTLIRCALGLIPFKGHAAIDGANVRTHGRAARRRVGYVPQEPALEADMRVREAVAFFARLRGANRDACSRAIENASLTEHRRKRVRELSGGMRQRLSLEVALLTDPPALILDEPTSSLDADARVELLARLSELRAQGKTILFTSHRPEEVKSIADRVVMMESGRIKRIEVADPPKPRDSIPFTQSASQVQVNVEGGAKA